VKNPGRRSGASRDVNAVGRRAARFAGRLAAVALLTLGAEGCAPHRPVASRAPHPPTQPSRGTAPPRTTPPPAIPGSYVEEGLASWYGVPFHGRRAANGEIYDMYNLTAAHRTLAFESIVRVTNLKNGRQAEVRINDRGPFVENRIIDLSLGAARELEMVAMGIVPVRLELLAGESPQVGNFTVQVGAFLVRENAARLAERLEERYQPVFIVEYDSPAGLFYRVRVGRVVTQDAARQLAEQLRSEEGVVPFAVRLDE
jgi:rare lipoprotein A